MTKIAALTELLRGTDCVGESDSLAGLRRYNAAKAAINGNRKTTIENRLAAIRACLRPFNVIVTAHGSRVRIFNPLSKAELIWL